MKVFLTSSFFGKEKYQEWYTLVFTTLAKTGSEVLTPESEDCNAKLKLTTYAKTNSKKKLHYEAIRRGIKWAQAIIIEVSHEDFQLGYEATIALNLKKPVLALSIHEDFSRKITNPYFYGGKYGKNTLDERIATFLKTAEKETLSERFNLFLSSRQVENLETQAKEKGMNNSEYLRWLLDDKS